MTKEMLCTAKKSLSLRRCRCCGKPLSGRQLEFCSFGAGSCKESFWKQARDLGADQLLNKPVRVARQETVDLDAMTPEQRLKELTRAAKKYGVLS